jgi:hypothetical protein
VPGRRRCSELCCRSRAFRRYSGAKSRVAHRVDTEFDPALVDDPDRPDVLFECGDHVLVGGPELRWLDGLLLILCLQGHVNKLKVVKRQMFGRARFDLLRKRVLLAN